MSNPIELPDDHEEMIEQSKQGHLFLHRVKKDGWRDNVRMIDEDHLHRTLWVLRHTESLQWFIVRYRDGVIIAQSKNCEWTARE